MNFAAKHSQRWRFRGRLWLIHLVDRRRAFHVLNGKTIAITCSTGAVSILNNPWFGLSIDVSLHSAAGSNICILCVLSRGGELCSFWLPCEDEDERRRRQQELAGDEELSSLPGVVTSNHQDRGNKFLWEECQTMFHQFLSVLIGFGIAWPEIAWKDFALMKVWMGNKPIRNLLGNLLHSFAWLPPSFWRVWRFWVSMFAEWLAGSCLIDLQLFLFMSQSRLSRVSVSKYSNLTNIECARKWTCIFHIQVSKFFGNNRMLGETTWVTSKEHFGRADFLRPLEAQFILHVRQKQHQIQARYTSKA